jgi:hypothetical protein
VNDAEEGLQPMPEELDGFACPLPVESKVHLPSGATLDPCMSSDVCLN